MDGNNTKVVIIPKGNNDFFNGLLLAFNNNLLVAGGRFPYTLLLYRKATIFVYNTYKGEIEYEGEIVSSSRNAIVCQNLKFIKNIQRRSETRVSTDLNLIVKKIIVGDNRIIDLPKIFMVQALNLSAGGVLLFCNLDIKAPIKLLFELPIDEKGIYCTAEILRKEVKKNGYYYGCRFVGLTESEKDRIRGYVYKMQVANNKGVPN